MPFYCAIPCCEREHQSTNKSLLKLSLFRVPSDVERRQKWIDFVESECLRSGHANRELIAQYKEGTRFYICSQHFRDEDLVNKMPYQLGFVSRLTLSSTAVPSVMIAMPAPAIDFVGLGVDDNDHEVTTPTTSTIRIEPKHTSTTTGYSNSTVIVPSTTECAKRKLLANEPSLNGIMDTVIVKTEPEEPIIIQPTKYKNQALSGDENKLLFGQEIFRRWKSHQMVCSQTLDEFGAHLLSLHEEHCKEYKDHSCRQQLTEYTKVEHSTQPIVKHTTASLNRDIDAYLVENNESALLTDDSEPALVEWLDDGQQVYAIFDNEHSSSSPNEDASVSEYEPDTDDDDAFSYADDSKDEDYEMDTDIEQQSESGDDLPVREFCEDKQEPEPCMCDEGNPVRHFHCLLCEDTFATVAALLTHKSAAHPDNYFCLMCKKVFDNESILTDHIKKNHRHAAFCNICQLMYENFFVHKAMKHDNSDQTLKCNRCHTLCSTKWALKTHMSRLHTKKKCTLCDFEGENLTKHTRESHSNGNIRKKRVQKTQEKVTCDVCHKQYSTIRQLRKHKSSRHPAGDTVECESCGKKFGDYTALNAHVKQVHIKENFTCAMCDKTFSNKTTYNKHISRVHSDRQRPACDVCAKVFSCEYNLKVHKKIHNNQKDYQCSYCSQSFSQLWYMKVHEQTHSKEKLAHQCDTCGKCYAHKTFLTKHSKTCKR